MKTLYRLELETFTVKLRVQESPDQLAQARSSEDVYRIVRAIYEELDCDQEHFLLLILNNKNRIRGSKVLATGNQTTATFDPVIVFRMAILYGASAIIVAHNHPSGDPMPSQNDIAVTRRLKTCADLHGIRLLDHIIIGYERYFSFADRCLLDDVNGGSTMVMDAQKTNGKPEIPERRFRKNKGIRREPRNARRATEESLEIASQPAEIPIPSRASIE